MSSARLQRSWRRSPRGFVAFVHLGAWLAGAAGTPVPADAIVALGGDGGTRAIEAAALYRQKLASTVVITGLEESPEEARVRYLDWRAKVLEDAGVPHDAVIYDLRSKNSRDEAVHTRELMQRQGWKRVMVVSDPPHMRRLLWTWRRAFAGTGLQFVLVAATASWWRPEHWWRDESSGKYVANEVIKLAYYMLTK